MAAFPLGFVFFGLVVPALLLGAIGRLLPSSRPVLRARVFLSVSSGE
jgi:hypothetical protein